MAWWGCEEAGVKSKKSIVRTVVVGTLLAIFVTTAVANLIMYLVDVGSLRKEIDVLAENVVSRLEYGVQKPLWDFDRQQVETLIRLEMGQRDLLAIVIRETNGNIYAGFDRSGGRMVHYTNDATQKGGLGSAIVTGAREIRYQDVTIGTIEVYLSREHHEARTERLLLRFLVQLLAISAAISFVVGFLLKRLVYQPLYGLITVVRRFGERDLAARVHDLRENELGELGRSFNSMAVIIQTYNQQLEQIVAERTRELTDKNEKILESIRYAMRLQESILPDPEMLRRFFSEHFVVWKPKDIVGGDFYWSHETGGNHFLAVVDCTGHGVPGALMTMTVNALLNHIIEDICCDDPALILKQLNLQLKKTLHQEHHENSIDDGLEIGLCLVRPAAGEMLYAGAKLALLVQSGDGAITVIRGDRQAIGYKRSRLEYDYAMHRIALVPGMRFYLASDGFLDQNGTGHPFGIGLKMFQRFVEAAAPIPLDEQGPYFEEALRAWMGTEIQRDDITLVGFVVRTGERV